MPRKKHRFETLCIGAAAMHVPDPAPFRDAQIAATALHHGMTTITRNTRDFERSDDVRVTNPWD